MILSFGDLVVDLITQAEGKLNYGSDVPGKIVLRGGGSAANFATWAAYLGFEVSFVARVGQDLFGEYLRQELINAGVKTYLTRDVQEGTGKILILLTENGERTMLTDRGANLNFQARDIPSQLYELATHLHVTAYSFFGREELLVESLKAIKKAQRDGLSVSLDPSSYALLREFGVKNFLQSTAGIDFLFPNLDEGRILTGYHREKDIVQKLLEYYPQVILKLGEKGCLIGKRGSGELISLAAATNAPVLDTTGAGDAFAAAFMVEVLKGKSLQQAGEKAVKIAGQCINIKGGRPPL